jgi:hypothetical protein
MTKTTRHSTQVVLNRVGGKEHKPPKDGDPRYTCPPRLEPIGTFDHCFSASHMILNAYIFHRASKDFFVSLYPM